MKKTQQAASPEIVFGSAEPKVSVAISRQVKAGRFARIAPKLYTSNLKDPPENIVQRNLYAVMRQSMLQRVNCMGATLLWANCSKWYRMRVLAGAEYCEGTILASLSCLVPIFLLG